MRNAVTPAPRDPEFDGPGHPGRRPTPDVARHYQRLVLNPFLAVIAGCLGGGAAILGRSRGALWVLPTVTVGVSVAFLFLQYHCLDCGATGWYRGWRRHACPRVCERWSHPFRHGMPLFPSPTTQLVLWFVVSVVALMLASTSR